MSGEDMVIANLMGSMVTELAKLSGEVAGVREEVGGLRQEVAGVKEERRIQNGRTGKLEEKVEAHEKRFEKNEFIALGRKQQRAEDRAKLGGLWDRFETYGMPFVYAGAGGAVILLCQRVADVLWGGW